MMIKEFYDRKGTNLLIEHNRTNVILKTNKENITKDYYLSLYFDKNVFEEMIKYLEGISKTIWKDFEPKEANSINSDYAEYFDKKYDNNGYLTIFCDSALKIERPSDDCPYMYKFNKRRMESFIYDLKK